MVGVRKHPKMKLFEKVVETKEFGLIVYLRLESTTGSLVVQRHEVIYFSTYKNGSEFSNLKSALFLSGKKVPQHKSSSFFFVLFLTVLGWPK